MIGKICLTVVIGGVLFKLGAIAIGCIQGHRLGKKLKEEKERRRIAAAKPNISHGYTGPPLKNDLTVSTRSKN